VKPTPLDTTEVVRAGVEKAAKDLSARIEALGFKRTKRMLWVRRHQHTADFITLFRDGSSYGKPRNYSVSFTVSFGIRVLKDDFESLSLNGPLYDYSERLRAAHYHFRFNAQTGSTYNRCVEDLVRYVVQEGEPWFSRFRETKALLDALESPLRESQKARLRQAFDEAVETAAISQSLKLLGIKDR